MSRYLLDKLNAYPVKKWFTTEIPNLARDLLAHLASASAVSAGGLVANGTTVTASALGLISSAVDAKIGGVLKTQLAALVTNVDVTITAAGVGQPIFADGTDASAISLATDEVAQVTLVVTDSDGAGAATGEDGAMLYVAIIAGTATTYMSTTAPVTDSGILAALEASTGVHDGATGAARLADIVWDENSASPTSVTTANRDV